MEKPRFLGRFFEQQLRSEQISFPETPVGFKRYFVAWDHYAFACGFDRTESVFDKSRKSRLYPNLLANDDNPDQVHIWIDPDKDDPYNLKAAAFWARVGPHELYMPWDNFSPVVFSGLIEEGQVARREDECGIANYAIGSRVDVDKVFKVKGSIFEAKFVDITAKFIPQNSPAEKVA